MRPRCRRPPSPLCPDARVLPLNEIAAYLRKVGSPMTSEIGPVHFLLVDDLEENLLALEALLRRDGLVLLKARSGTEALELLLNTTSRLRFFDVQMPEMDGFELAELMRGTERTRRVADHLSHRRQRRSPAPVSWIRGRRRRLP